MTTATAATPVYTTAVDGLDTGVRVYHRDVPSSLGTITKMGVFVATVQYDNGVTARQSIGVLCPKGERLDHQ